MFQKTDQRPGFTLVELLVVVAILALLVSILLPSLSAAKERARVVKVHVELRGIGLSLEMYAGDGEQGYPPVRVACNADMRGHENQLPVELCNEQYLPRGPHLPDGRLDPRRMVGVEDPFNLSHTYKYNAPGDLIVNNMLIKNGNDVWVPDIFPYDNDEGDLNVTDDGQWYNDPAKSPVRWILWSLGPNLRSAKTLSSRAPISRRTWYKNFGDNGVICRIMSSTEEIIMSP